MYERALRPGRIGTLHVPHRIVMGSMHLGLEARDDGGAALAAFYAERAANGAGLIVTGGSAISRVGAGGRNYSFVNDDADAEKLRRVAEAVHAAGALIALQLFHAGRYAFEASFGLQPVAPSAVPSRFSRTTPRALDEDEILATIADFARAASRARAFGFDAVEIMASEGYLINQFLSPVTNRRDDAWGGDAERRRRFGGEVLRAVREAVGAAFPVIVRISGADLVEGSSTEEETVAFARALAERGADALNVGIGWHESPVPTVQMVVPPARWIGYAEAVKRAVGALPVIASNRITTVALAERVLRETQLDFVSLARPFLADPALVRKARDGGEPVNVCIACNQACLDRSLVEAEVSCMVNPRAGRELEFPAAPPPARRGRFAVAGGGPAGLEAARALAALGARVELFEAETELGGQFRLARRIPAKHDYGETIRYFERELRRLGVVVHLSRRLDAADAATLRAFDGVVVATGVTPRELVLPGAQLPHVVRYADAIASSERLGRRVAVVGGGGIGVDVAHLLSHEGAHEVTVLRRGPTIGDRIGRSTRWAVLAELRARGVRLMPNVTYERIVPKGIVVRAGDERLAIEADSIVVAIGQERNDPLSAALAAAGVPHRVVGGAHVASELDAVRAFDEGLRAAHALAEVGTIGVR